MLKKILNYICRTGEIRSMRRNNNRRMYEKKANNPTYHTMVKLDLNNSSRRSLKSLPLTPNNVCIQMDRTEYHIAMQIN